jgi:hypothetical protein
MQLMGSCPAVADGFAFSQPLVNRLGDSVRVIFLDDVASAGDVLEIALSGTAGSRSGKTAKRTGGKQA